MSAVRKAPPRQLRPGAGAAAAAAQSSTGATKALGGRVISNKAAQQVVQDERRESAEQQARRSQPLPLAESHGPARPQRPPRPLQTGAAGRKIVVILAKAGLKVGYDGLIDAYDRQSTTIAPQEPHLAPYRPDIVHQCLLALFDSDMAAAGRLQVIISTERGKTIEVSPTLRPPRTYGRFKGLMTKLLTDGVVTNNQDGQWLLRTTRWSVAPQIPHGAEVYGIHNSPSSPVVSALELARGAVAEPVPDVLQGGIKNAYGFYVISCTDDSNLDGIDYVTKPICISAFPTTPHVACLRIAEGFRYATSAQTNAATTAAAAEAGKALEVALQAPALGQKKRVRDF